MSQGTVIVHRRWAFVYPGRAIPEALGRFFEFEQGGVRCWPVARGLEDETAHGRPGTVLIEDGGDVTVCVGSGPREVVGNHRCEIYPIALWELACGDIYDIGGCYPGGWGAREKAPAQDESR